MAFYDALAENNYAKEVICDEKSRMLAMELALRVRQSVTIYWDGETRCQRSNTGLVKRTQRQYGYPPTMEAKATNLLLELAEAWCKEWDIAS